jgi:hypothetical protein
MRGHVPTACPGISLPYGNDLETDREIAAVAGAQMPRWQFPDADYVMAWVMVAPPTAGPGHPTGVDIAVQEARGLSQRRPMAHISEYSIVTYERRPGLWRAAIAPFRRSILDIKGRTVNSFVTPDDFASEVDAKFAAEKIIDKL